MSYTETCFGKIRKLGIYEKPIGLEKYCETRLCQQYQGKWFEYKRISFPSYIHSWFDALNDALYKENKGELFYNENTGELWESYNVKELDEDYFCEMINEGGDTYTFVTQFYNGGTCLSEILQEEIEKL